MLSKTIAFLKQLRDLYLVRVKWRRYKIGKHFHAGARVNLWARDTLVIGQWFYIGRDSFIEADCMVGDHVIFGNRVAIVGRYDHHYQQLGEPIRLASQMRDKDYNWKGLNNITVIEDDVWVGYGSTIMSGVRIGQGSIIAAGSLVTRDVEKFSIYGGSPAKKLKNRFDSEEDLQKHLLLYNKKYKKA